MSKKQNILERLILKIIQFKVKHWFNLEKKLTARPKYIKAIEHSPEKSWPNPDKIPGGEEIPFSMQNIKLIGKHLRSCIKEGELAIKSIKYNSENPTRSISTEQLNDFKEYAKSLGIGDIGFTKIPKHLIFKERAICYDNVIVLVMEMNKEAIS